MRTSIQRWHNRAMILENAESSGSIITWPEANILATGLLAFKSSQACLCFDRFLANCIESLLALNLYLGAFYRNRWSRESVGKTDLLEASFGLLCLECFKLYGELERLISEKCNWHQHNLIFISRVSQLFGFPSRIEIDEWNTMSLSILRTTGNLGKKEGFTSCVSVFVVT